MSRIVHTAKAAGNEINIIFLQIHRVLWMIVSSVLFIPAFIMAVLNKIKPVIGVILAMAFYTYSLYGDCNFKNMVNGITAIFSESRDIKKIILTVCLAALICLILSLGHKALGVLYISTSYRVDKAEDDIRNHERLIDKNMIIAKYGSTDNYINAEMTKFRSNKWFVAR